MLIAAPFRTSRTQGAILIYPRAGGRFHRGRKGAGGGDRRIRRGGRRPRRTYATAHAQAHELHQLLEISSELSSSGDLDHFLQAFVVRAADFLGFGRCFIALLEDGQFRVRYAVESGEPRRVDTLFPEGIATRALRAKEVFWSDEASQHSWRQPGNHCSKYQVQQFLAVPLLGADGSVLGMFGVLDRLDGTGISQEDIRRARALPHRLRWSLEVARNLHLSEQHRRRAEALVELAREIDGLLRLPDFARRFVGRATELTGARAGALALFQEGRFQTAALNPMPHVLAPVCSEHPGLAGVSEVAPHSPSVPPPSVPPDHDQTSHDRTSQDHPREDHLDHFNQSQRMENRSAENPIADARSRGEDHRLQQHLAQALTELAAKRADAILFGTAADYLEPIGFQSRLDRLHGCAASRFNGRIAGALCLSGRSGPLTSEDRDFLEAIAGHAAMALENARLFTRIEQANRHWMEIFDAITDFIVVHDETDKVLRVNRSLAAMIGVAPSELIGVNMRALLALTSEPTLYSCPFCRSMGEETDEFVHPVLDRTYLVSTSRVHGASGEGLQTIHVLKDISDRREAERRYRELFDNIQEGLFFSTPGGRFVEVNDAMVACWDMPAARNCCRSTFPRSFIFRPSSDSAILEAMEEHGHLRNYEATLRRKDGSPIHVLINAFGLYDNLGRLLQIRGLMLDVTGLHTYQSELHRERDFSGKILSNTQSLILVADTAGLISYANRRWYDAGFEQRELLGRPLLELAAPGYVRPLAEALQATLRGQQVDNLELQIVRGNGHAGKFSANLSPMRDEQGNVTSIVVVMTDITDSAVLRDKLVHAEKNGGGRAAGLRRRPRSQQSADRDPRLRRPADGESRPAGNRPQGSARDSAGGAAHQADRAEPAQLCPPDAAAAQRGAVESHPAPHHAAAFLRLQQPRRRHRGTSRRRICPTSWAMRTSCSRFFSTS